MGWFGLLGEGFEDGKNIVDYLGVPVAVVEDSINVENSVPLRWLKVPLHSFDYKLSVELQNIVPGELEFIVCRCGCVGGLGYVADMA